MRRILTSLAGLSILAFSGPVLALGLGGEAVETEAARANARAGGPTNARDAELLERYGCLSGTRSEFCSRLEHRRAREWRRDPHWRDD